MVRVSTRAVSRAARLNRLPSCTARKVSSPLLADVDEKTQLFYARSASTAILRRPATSLDPRSYIYPRTLGLDARTTAELISSVTLGYVELGMGCVLKHFPGYRRHTDTHKGMSVEVAISLSLSRETCYRLLPASMRARGAVMVSYNIVTCIDPDYPSSLGRASVQQSFEGRTWLL